MEVFPVLAVVSPTLSLACSHPQFVLGEGISVVGREGTSSKTEIWAVGSDGCAWMKGGI